MIIYREDVEQHKVQDRSRMKGGLFGYKNMYVIADKVSFGSGNAFESLALTNPEEFDKVKLRQLQNSKNLVEDFNNYLDAILSSQSTKHLKWKSDNNIPAFYSTSDDNSKNMENFNMRFNTTIIGGMIEDMEILRKELKDEDEVRKAIREMYIPDALTEEGCRRLISIRLKNNQLITDTLTKSLRANFASYSLTEAEAIALIEELQNDSTNHSGMSKVKEILKDPKVLEKFKKGNNYDFRSIGGGCMFLSKDPSIQTSQHPSKRISMIFNYDAIVVGHGDFFDNKASGSSKLKNTVDNVKIASQIIAQMDASIKAIKANTSIPDDNKKKIINNLISIKNNLNNVLSENDEKKLDQKLAWSMDNFSRIFNEMRGILDPQSLSIIKNQFEKIFKIGENIKSSKDKDRIKRDGDSVNWVTQPISTFKKSNMTSVIDVIRALKAEGFKNIYIGNCNPGHVDLPDDIKNTKTFHVKFGTESVFLEDYEIDHYSEYRSLLEMENRIQNLFDIYGRDYEDMSLNQLYMEAANLESEIVTEGAIDRLKAIAKKAWGIIVAIWNKIIEFLKSIIKTIYGKIRSKFDKNYKPKKPIESSYIKANGKELVVVKTVAKSTDEINKDSQNAINSIKDFVNKTSQEEKKWMSNMNSFIDKKFSSEKGKVVDVDYKEVKESKIFRNIEFI